MTTTTTTKTPGYPMRLNIRFTIDSAGRPRAAYFSIRAFRWLPIKVADAHRWIAADQADAADKLGCTIVASGFEVQAEN
jgi:hypothetical protein